MGSQPSKDAVLPKPCPPVRDTVGKGNGGFFWFLF